MIKSANIVMTAGIIMCMFPFNDYWFALARLVWGLGAGSFTVFVPKYITEISPVEMSGSMGGMSQFMLTFGILVPSLLALVVPNDVSTLDTYYTNNYWRECWLLAVLLAVI